MDLPRYISPSALNNFIRCPYRWRCERYKFPSIFIDESARQFGFTCHNIYELYYRKIDDFPTKDEIIQAVEEAVTEGGSSFTDSRKKATRKIRDYLHDFEVNRVGNRVHKPELIEQRLSVKIWDDLPPILGIPDLFIRDTGTLIDWKFGKNAEITDEILVQGKMYEMILQSGDYDVKKVTFRYPVLGVKNNLPKVTDGWIYEKVRYMCDMIRIDKFPSREGFLCNKWCPFILSCKYKSECGWNM